MVGLDLPLSSSGEGADSRNRLPQKRPWLIALASVIAQLSVVALVVFVVSDSLTTAGITSRILARNEPVAEHARSTHTTSNATGTGSIRSESAFDVEQALADLSQITKTPHSLNDPRSSDVKDYLRRQINGIIDGSKAQFYDAESADGITASFKTQGWWVQWQDASLIVRVPGTSNRSEAFLVQAHYDAVPLSYGAYDDGVGVAVCLEILRNLIRFPVQHPVVINVDWGEENGLFGASMFARFHPWAEHVRGYLNLEAGGVGGRAMVFRASSGALLAAYKRAAGRPSASLIGNDAMRLGVVKSDTDYSVYTTRYGIPGLDMAFSEHRNLYHTARDSVAQADAASVLSMGAAALATVREVADSPSILREIPRSARLPPRPALAPANGTGGALLAANEDFGSSEPKFVIKNLRHVVVEHSAKVDDAVEDVVFYDALSLFMVVRSYTAETILNAVTAIVGLAVLVALQYPFTSPEPASSEDSAMRRFVWQCVHGVFRAMAEALVVVIKCVLSALFGSLIATGTLVILALPRLAYTHMHLQVFIQICAAMLSVTCVLTSWVHRSVQENKNAMIWYALAMFRCLVVLFVLVPLNAAHIGILYREQLYAWAAILGAILTAFLDDSTHAGKYWRTLVTARSSSGSDEHRERLLPDDDADSGSETRIPQYASNHRAVSTIMYTLSVLRMVIGVLAPLAVCVDTMLRQVVVLKDHLPDGSPPIACIAIIAVDATAVAMLVLPYILAIMEDPERYFIVRFLVARADALFGTDIPVHSRRANSTISLHTNRGEPRSSDSLASAPQDDDSEQQDNRLSAELSDDGLGVRPTDMQPKMEAPETIGRRMTVAWICAWFVLWLAALVVSLNGEGYDSEVNPLKIRVFQRATASSACLRAGKGAECVEGTLSLISPDNSGLARFVMAAAPKDSGPICYTANTRDLFTCKLKWRAAGETGAGEWDPATAIEINSIDYTTALADGAAVYTATVNFTARETRSCFVEFGRNAGLSLQSYPNAHPRPANGTVLPVLERVEFVDPALDKNARVVVEPIGDRDPAFSGRVFVHRRATSGEFSVVLKYSAPVAAGDPRPTFRVDLSCYFDVLERHAPLLDRVVRRAPASVVFTPHGNLLSQITVADIVI